MRDPTTKENGSDLKAAGLRITLPRLKVLQALKKSTDRHQSAEDVYLAVRELNYAIGLPTIYRILSQLEVAGIVSRHQFGQNPAVFELTDRSHHDHMVELESGKIVEFDEEGIEALQREIAEEHGYELVDHQLVLYVRDKT